MNSSHMIKAKHLIPGMFVFISGKHLFYVDDVEYTRDNKVLVRLGYDGTGTEFFDFDELVSIS